MGNDENNESGNGTSFVANISSFIDGIPIPGIIKKNLIRSASKLVLGAVDVPLAMLEAKVTQIKAESKAMTLITETSSKAVAEKFAVDVDLVERSINHFGSKLFKEQLNREKTVHIAMEDLRLNPPKEDATEEIDEDWLDMFSRIAETKSNADMQLLLGKILAGEIRSPNSFSAKTVHTLSTLSQNTAKIFQSFCNISFTIPDLGDIMTTVITEPFGSPGDNKLSKLGLSYSNLSILRDDGLIQHSFNSWRKFTTSMFYFPTIIGDRILDFKVEEKVPTDLVKKIGEDISKNGIRVTVLNFTQVGLELRRVMTITSHQSYNDKVIEWLQKNFKIKLKN